MLLRMTVVYLERRWKIKAAAQCRRMYGHPIFVDEAGCNEASNEPGVTGSKVDGSLTPTWMPSWLNKVATCLHLTGLSGMSATGRRQKKLSRSPWVTAGSRLASSGHAMHSGEVHHRLLQEVSDQRKRLAMDSRLRRPPESAPHRERRR